MNVCMYVCMYVCMCVYVCMYMFVYVCMYVNSETLVEKIFESAQHFRSGNYYTINVVPGFRSDSSLYCYRPVSYGQEMTTLIRQYERMTVNFNCWRYNTNSKV